MLQRPTEQKIRIAVAGLGKMGLSHLAIVRSHPNLEVAAVCDTAGYLLKFLKRNTGLNCYSSYSDMLKEEQLDAVLIATPPHLHEEMVSAALERNLHVFCEKPYCLDVESGRQLADEAQRRGLVTQVGYHYRFVGAFSEAKRLLQGGALGTVHHVRLEAYGPVVLGAQGSTWRSSSKAGGGCLYDYASHAIDLGVFLHRAPVSVRGTVLGKVHSKNVADEVYSTFFYPDESTGQLAVNWSDDSFRRMFVQATLWGSLGRMRVDRQELQVYLREDNEAFPTYRKGWNTLYTTDLTPPVSYYLRGEEYSAQIDHFASCISKSETSISSFSDAIETDLTVAKLLEDSEAPTLVPTTTVMPDAKPRPMNFLGKSVRALLAREKGRVG